MDVYDKLFKVVIIGDAAVGKTNILLRYTKDEFDDNSRSTIGVGFGYKNVNINDQNIRLQIWDTAGQERFRATPSAYYRGAHGVIIVFDVCDKSSFVKLTSSNSWLEDLTKYMVLGADKILVGNKIDRVESREVTTQEAKEFAEKNEMKYYETSAKQDIGITPMFEDLANILLNESEKQLEPSTYDKPYESPVDIKISPSIDLKQNEPPPTKCCK
jgi:small GTP-binding protein